MYDEYEYAQDFLESALRCRLEQDRILARIGEMRTRCLKITPTLSAVPGGGNADAQAQWAALADEERRLTRLLQEELDHARAVEAFINRLSVPIHQELLKLRYLDFLTIPGVVRRLERTGYHRSQRHIERLFAAALDEAEELFRLDKLKGDCAHEQRNAPEDQT